MDKTNPVLKDAQRRLEEAGRKNDAAVYSEAAAELAKPGSNHTEINLSDIQRNAEDGDTVLVPGKVLGAGVLDIDVTVAALGFTQGARAAIDEAGTVQYLDELVDDNPDGQQVRLLK